MAIFRTNKSFILILLTTLFIFIFQDLFFFENLYAQDSAKELLKKGVQQYKNAEFDSAIQTLEQTARLQLEKEHKIQLYKYLAFSYAAIGNENQAKLNYLKLLEVDQFFNLSLTESPRLRTPFQLAQKEYLLKDKNSPVINMELPEQILEKTELEICANVTDKSGIESVLLYYKNLSDRQFSQLEMENTYNDSFKVVIPADKVTVNGLLFYIQATDKVNNPPAYKGNKENPLNIKVTKLDNEPPQIIHEPIEQAQVKSLIDIKASITDNNGVNFVMLFYRPEGKQKYKSVKMESSGNNFKYSLRVGESGVEYFIAAKTINVEEPLLWKSYDNPQKVIVKKDQTYKKKKSTKKWVWIGIGGVLIGGGVVAAIISAGNETATISEVESRLPDPPSGP